MRCFEAQVFQVWKASYNQQEVAVKILKETATAQSAKDFNYELSLLIEFKRSFFCFALPVYFCFFFPPQLKISFS